MGSPPPPNHFVGQKSQMLLGIVCALPPRSRCSAVSARCGLSRLNFMLIRAVLMNLHSFLNTQATRIRSKPSGTKRSRGLPLQQQQRMEVARRLLCNGGEGIGMERCEIGGGICVRSFILVCVEFLSAYPLARPASPVPLVCMYERSEKMPSFIHPPPLSFFGWVKIQSPVSKACSNVTKHNHS